MVRDTFAAVIHSFDLSVSTALRTNLVSKETINSHGVLTDLQIRQVRTIAYRDVILPTLEAAQWSSAA